ncbi:hypothetical protein ASU31_10275 [Pedobacter ginsenosidimutans]|uniref:DUF2199 domain-containing protein n=1 Tax=Pedobacter ginsenosidimutans TaxID=687842 RepID=A0A0T5VRQ7_9SPHI|nr:DUF2199 domain-containing protein [Pedobacter ginsenosidimutans]KRT16538.1 hypothetical protein ASU31_10275 [Pedobacter ginsenosidimutans]
MPILKLFSFFNKPKNKHTYTCSCCGQVYHELPLCFGSDYPDYYFSVPPNEIAERIEINESWCVVDKQHFFHRGRITIPVLDYSENLIFNVWSSISPDNFNKRMELWKAPDRITQEPYFGWLQTIVPTYGDTLNIKTIAVEQQVGLIPEIKLIEEGHRLTFDQENGITYKKAVEIVDQIMSAQHHA